MGRVVDAVTAAGEDDDGATARAAGVPPGPDLARVLTGVAVGVAGLWLAVIVLWPHAVFSMTFDDAWYYWGIADNVAAGHGSTFDGVNETNGYHPLWLALSVPAYALGAEGMGAGRLLLAVQAVLYGAALVVLARGIARQAGDWRRTERLDATRRRDVRTTGTAVVATAWALLCVGPFVLKTFVNGMESAVLVLAYALLLVRVLRPTPRRLLDTDPRWQWWTGAVLVLLFLARTDAAVVAGCLGLWLVAGHRRGEAGATLRAVLRVGGPVALALLAFLVANQLAFDTPLQVSGLHKRADLTGARIVVLALTWGGAALVGWRSWRAAGRAPRASRFPRVADLWRRTGWYVAGCLVLVGYYHGLQTQQWLWYYSPLVLYLLVLVPLTTADFVETAVVEGRPDAPVRRTVLPVAAILVVPILVGSVVQVGGLVDPDVRSIQEANRDTAEWIGDNLPDDAVLASWDAGVVGYFTPQRVVNIDGLVNSKAFYDATQEGTVGDFLRADGVRYLVNHGQDVDGENPLVRPWLAATFGEDVAREAVVVHHEPFDFSGSTVGPSGRRSDRSLAMFVYAIDP